jgi:hypothetical protein
MQLLDMPPLGLSALEGSGPIKEHCDGWMSLRDR